MERFSHSTSGVTRPCRFRRHAGTGGWAALVLSASWVLAVARGEAKPAGPAPPGTGLAAEKLATVKLTPERLPKGWLIAREQEATPDQLPPFEQRLGAKITGIVSQLLESKQGKVQVNYVSFLIPDEMARAYQVMQQRAQGTVTVVRVGRIAIEIGATSEPLKALATSWFPLSRLQSLKIKQHQVSGKWLLRDETMATERELQREAADHGVELSDKLSQFFVTKTGAGIRVDLYQPAETADVRQLQSALLRSGDLRNKLLVVDGCLVQIRTNDVRARDEAERLLKANAEPKPVQQASAQAGE